MIIAVLYRQIYRYPRRYHLYDLNVSDDQPAKRRSDMSLFKLVIAVVLTFMPLSAGAAEAIFAGGCFWCMEKPFEHVAGVSEVISGYSGGRTLNPTYDNYVAGGHIEVVKVIYDVDRVSYEQLLEVYWHQINPTDAGGQFVDRGHAYTTAIFYLNESQKRAAIASKQHMDESGIFGKPIVTPILPAATFWPAEEYHQNYYRKNPVRYWYYRSRSGRDDYLRSIWGEDAGDRK